MKLNRRQFIKGLMAAAVAANVPDFTIEEAEAAADAFANAGIEDYGNGWYRVWMHVKDDDMILSTYAKAAESDWIAMTYNRITASFNLRTGTLGKTVFANKSQKVTQGPVGFSSDGAYLWGQQLEPVHSHKPYQPVPVNHFINSEHSLDVPNPVTDVKRRLS